MAADPDSLPPFPGDPRTEEVGAPAPRREDPLADELVTVSPERYEVRGEAGRGGLGRVLIAHDRRLGRTVALKELLAPSAQARARFLREALVTARLQHPAIVPVYEAGRWPGGEPFYAMKLIEGKSLADLIAARPTLEERLGLLPHVTAVAEAVAYAHARGVVHRDLKPGNVVVGAFGETVLIDWGVAKLRGDGEEAAAAATTTPAELTVQGAIVGTPAYMPPEQAFGSADERADVYALGAMLYHLLAGAPPYLERTAVEVLAALHAGPPEPLARRAPGVPRDLLAVVDKAMARTVEDRYAKALDLVADLRRFQTGQLVRAHEYGALERLRRFVRRHRLPLAVAAVAGALLVTVAALSAQRIVRERNQAQAERARAEETARELRLVNARTSLASDPTATIGFLADYPLEAPGWNAVHILAGAALERGLADEVLRGHAADVFRVAFAPDGRLASAGFDGKIRVWPDRELGLADLATALVWSADGQRLAAGSARGELVVLDRELHVLARPGGHRERIFSLDLDGERVLSAATDGVRLWLGHESRELLPGTYYHALFVDDRHVAAAGADGVVRLVDLADGRVSELVRHAGAANRLARAPGRLASAGEDGVIWLWDDLGRPPQRVATHGAAVDWLAFSPDGQELSSADHAGKLLSWRDGQSRSRGRELGDLLAGAYSPDGRVLAVAGERGVHVFRGDEHLVFTGHAGVVDDVAFSPDGARLASAARDNQIRLWRLPAPPPTLRPAERPRRLAVAGEQIAVADVSGGVSLWRPGGEARELVREAQRVRALEWSSRGVLALGGGDGTVLVWDGRALVRHADSGKPILCLAWDARGERLAAAGVDGTIYLHEGGQVRALRGHAAEVTDLTFSPDGRRLASGGRDGEIRLWDLARGEVRPLPGHTGAVRRLRFSPDGKLLASAGDDRRVRLTGPAGEEVAVLDEHGDAVIDLAFVEDGHALVSASKEQLHVWPLGGSRLARRRLDGHQELIRAMVALPGGRRVVSADRAGEVWLWDLASGTGRVLGRHTDEVWALAALDAHRVVSAGQDGAAFVWTDALPDEPAALRAWLQAHRRDQ